jgi:hypothetical protein
MMRAFLIVAMFELLEPAANAQGQCRNNPREVTSFGILYEPAIAVTAQDSFELLRPPDGVSVRYFRALLRISPRGAKGWVLTLRDSHERPLESLSAADFTQSASRWTGRLADNSFIELDLAQSKSAAPVNVTVDEAIVMPDAAAGKPQYYSWQDPAAAKYVGLDTLNSGQLSVKRLGDTVGFLMASWKNQGWCCSGVLIAPTLFLTNWHCGGLPSMGEEEYWQSDIKASLLIDFSWDGDQVSREYSASKLEAASEKLDFALLRVAPLNGSDPIIPATVRKKKVGKEALILIHHSECKTKQISRACEVDNPDYPGWIASSINTEFSHTCDTEKGGSGGAVFDMKGFLVGLHHLGFKIDDQCNPQDHVDKAVSILDILKALPADLRRVVTLK